MANRTYQQDVPEENIKDFGVRFIGINREKPPGLVTNHCGIPALFFLQLHTSCTINNLKTEKQATIIWLPGQTHSFGSTDTTWSHSWIKFLGQRAITIFKEYNIPLGKVFYLKRDQLFEKYATLISEELRPHVNPDIRIIENLYRNLLLEIERDIADKTVPVIPDNIQKVKDLLDTKYYKDMHLKDISSEFNLAANYLTSEFKNYYGLTIINYLIQVRVFHAKMLLGNLELNVSEVAGEVGYQDIQHFSKLFKKHTGLSPSEFRKNIK